MWDENKVVQTILQSGMLGLLDVTVSSKIGILLIGQGWLQAISLGIPIELVMLSFCPRLTPQIFNQKRTIPNPSFRSPVFLESFGKGSALWFASIKCGVNNKISTTHMWKYRVKAGSWPNMLGLEFFLYYEFLAPTCANVEVHRCFSCISKYFTECLNMCASYLGQSQNYAYAWMTWFTLKCVCCCSNHLRLLWHNLPLDFFVFASLVSQVGRPWMDDHELVCGCCCLN